MTTKIRVGVIFGGRSGEHEVSLESARSVIANLNPDKYEVTQIGIDHFGRWFSGEDVLSGLLSGSIQGLTHVTLLPEMGLKTLFALESNGELHPYAQLDVIFPVLHGTFGEDGTIQGLLELAGFAYVGAGVLGSAVGMDKGLFKAVMQAYQLPVLPSMIFTRKQIESDLEEVINACKKISAFPLFCKPANLGSSVGITKINSHSDLVEGLLEAARFDRRILVEKGLDHPIEIEVSVLGNDSPAASLPGEVIPGDDFYTYNAKYLADNSKLIIPANLPADLIEQIRTYAVQVYQAMDCAGMARVDFLIDRLSQQVFISEVNTIPGFTRISMYPKLWEATGLSYPALIEKLIDLALERQADREHTVYEYRRIG